MWSSDNLPGLRGDLILAHRNPPSSPSIRGNAAAAPPAFQQSPPTAWPQEDCANEPTGFFACGERNSVWALGARFALVLLLLVASLSSQAAVREVGAIGLTAGDLDREMEFNRLIRKAGL